MQPDLPGRLKSPLLSSALDIPNNCSNGCLAQSDLELGLILGCAEKISLCSLGGESSLNASGAAGLAIEFAYWDLSDAILLRYDWDPMAPPIFASFNIAVLLAAIIADISGEL
jgi:hypothetical protein